MYSKFSPYPKISQGFPINDESELNDIHRSIQTLRTLIPQILNEYIVNTIYERTSISIHADFLEEELTFNEPKIEVPLSEVPNFQKISRKTVAYIFCDWLKGNTTIDERKKVQGYEQALFPILMQALEQLQTFLVKQGKIGMRSSQKDLDKMFRLVAQSRSLPPEMCDIFANIIKGMHQIIPYESVTKQEALILYKVIKRTIYSPTPQQECQVQDPIPLKFTIRKKQTVKQVQQKEKNIKNEEKGLDEPRKERGQKYQLHKQWIPAYEELLLALYKKTPNISQIRDRFQLVFPQHSRLFSVQALRSKLFKILRVAIKRIEQMAKHSPNAKIPPLMRLNDSRVKAIINNHNFRKIRLCILDAHSRGYDMRLVNEAVNSINLSVSEMEIQSNHIPRVGCGRSKQAKVQIPPLYHPLNSKPVRVKEVRLKYNRQFRPLQKGQMLIRQKENAQSGQAGINQ